MLTLSFGSVEASRDFYESCTEFLAMVRQSTMEIDSALLKSFLSADANGNNLLDQQEVLRIFRKIRLQDQDQISKLMKYI